MQPNVIDLRYFKLIILLDQIIYFWNITPSSCKDIGIRTFELVTYSQFLSLEGDHSFQVQSRFALSIVLYCLFSILEVGQEFINDPKLWKYNDLQVKFGLMPLMIVQDYRKLIRYDDLKDELVLDIVRKLETEIRARRCLKRNGAPCTSLYLHQNWRYEKGRPHFENCKTTRFCR